MGAERFRCIEKKIQLKKNLKKPIPFIKVNLAYMFHNRMISTSGYR